MSKELRVIVSGGGTGGHIFPAVSIANAVRRLRPDARILFIGAQGRMEMQRVPAAGYEIKGLPIRGFFRPLWKPANIGVAFDYLKSKWLAKKILKEFRPDVAVGVGGYASSAALGAANSLGIPTLIQEQNSYAGLANKNLAKRAEKICVAYEGMERFFPKEKLMLTGNPVRQALLDTTISREDAVRSLGFDPSKKTILIVGGSLGARTINESVLQHLDLVGQSGVQFLWQTGKYYYASIQEQLKGSSLPNLKATDFITEVMLIGHADKTEVQTVKVAASAVEDVKPKSADVEFRPEGLHDGKREATETGAFVFITNEQNLLSTVHYRPLQQSILLYEK